MPMIEVPPASAAFTANGGATGIITVADSSVFYPGCEAFITHDSAAGVKVIIVAIASGTTLVARIVAEDTKEQPAIQRYGAGSNLSAYTSVGNAKLWMPRQLARVEINTVKPTSLNK